MRSIRKFGRFLWAVFCCFIVIWPVLSLLFLSLLGTGLLFVPQITETWVRTTAATFWPGFAVGLSVVVAAIAARRFIRESYSLKRLTVFAVLVYPFVFLVGLTAQYALAFAFDFSSAQFTDIGSTTTTAVFSLFAFVIAAGLSYVLVYRNGSIRPALTARDT